MGQESFVMRGIFRRDMETYLDRLGFEPRGMQCREAGGLRICLGEETEAVLGSLRLPEVSVKVRTEGPEGEQALCDFRMFFFRGGG